eukprot:2468825-Prymnesium_polylepis.2
MDRAQGATQGCLPQNLRGTHTSSVESSGRPYVAAALLGSHRRWSGCARHLAIGGGKETFGRGRTHTTRILTRAQGFEKWRERTRRSASGLCA